MKKPLFTGVCTALVTPFTNGAVNYPMLEQLIHRQIAAGIPAIVLCGTTGEASTLSDEEKITIIQKGVTNADKKCCILAGTGSNDTRHAIDLSIAAEESGADGLLIVSPYYNKATPDGLIQHYSAIADAVDIPIIIYNIPSRTGIDIPIDVYSELSQHPNIIGVKEANPDLSRILSIRTRCPDDFYIWSGNDDLTVPIMSLGGKGVISVASNISPELVNAMSLAALNGDFSAASALQIKLEPLIRCLFREVNPIPVKEAMKLIGYDCGECRLPLTRASKTTWDALQYLLTKN